MFQTLNGFNIILLICNFSRHKTVENVLDHYEIFQVDTYLK